MMAGASLPGGALAADDVFTQIFSAIGLTTPEREPIEYRERAPLVVPPKSGLREPVAPNAQRNAAWPNDPDVVSRRQAAADRNAPVPSGKWTENPEMRPGQLRAGPRTATNRLGVPDYSPNENDASVLMIRPTRDMRAADAERIARDNLSNLRPGEEPERKSLSEPPRGYRKPTEIVRATGEPARTQDASKPLDYIFGQRRN